MIHTRRLVCAAILAGSLVYPAAAQDNPLLTREDAQKQFTRALQLVEATSISVPGLARAAAPVVENARQAMANLEVSPGGRHAGHTYSFLTALQAYQALADSMPKPYPFPAAATGQFAELRTSIDRLLAHFRALLDTAESQLRTPDPDNVRRYAEANSRLSDPEAKNPRVVFLGDSITDAWRLNEYFPGSDFINRGIGGQITGQMLGRMKPDVVDLKPAAVVILAGTNDIARNIPIEVIKNNLTSIAELAAAHDIRVVLAGLLPVHDYLQDQDRRFHRTTSRPPKIILDLNDWIRRYAAQHGHVYLDYLAGTVDENGALRKNLSGDGLHPNADGYRIMAPLVKQAIETALKPAPQRRRRLPF